MMDIFHSRIIVLYVHNFIWNNFSKWNTTWMYFGTEIFKFLKLLLYHFYLWTTWNNNFNLIISLLSLKLFNVVAHLYLLSIFPSFHYQNFFLSAGWKVAEGKGFNRSKLFCRWKSIQHLSTLTHWKNYLLEAFWFGYILFIFPTIL